MPTAFLLNPPRRTKRRKARRVKGRSRRRVSARRSSRRSRRSRKSYASGRSRRRVRATRRRSSRRRRNAWFNDHKGHVKAGKLGAKRRRSGGRRRKNPSSRRRGGSRGGGVMGLSLAVPEVIPFRLPLPGILGTISNGIIQAAAAGGVMFTGYVVSGQIVNFVEETVLKDTLAGKWRRPLLFAALAGAIGGVVSMVAPKGKKAMWSLLAASGPGVRAFAGIVNNLIPADVAPGGIAADIKKAANGLADYIQVGDLYEAGLGGDEYAGGWGEDSMDEPMGDYIQVGDLYEAGLGKSEEVVGF